MSMPGCEGDLDWGHQYLLQLLRNFLKNTVVVSLSEGTHTDNMPLLSCFPFLYLTILPPP